MTTYRRYNKPQNDREKQPDSQPKKSPLSVFELQCIVVFLLIASLLLIKAFAADTFEKINGFIGGAIGETSSSETSSQQTAAEKLAEYIAGQLGESEISEPATSTQPEESEVPEETETSELQDILSGLSVSGEDILAVQTISISNYKIDNEETVTYCGDLVPVSLLTETDTAKTDSFAQKAEGGLLKAPDGCSFEPYFSDVKLNAPITGKITCKFGYRYHPITGLFGFHTGTDIAANSGTAIYAAAAGKVIERGYSDVWGYYMLIQHSDSTQTFYAHCKKLLKSKGASVKSGEKIATVGSTGWSTGPHLHFEVRINGVYVDPEWIL
ncbi:MAG TPA: M23 family metallopeptidase [Oscillospiraceae bacterium]|nr:M23 family metallopeptidase [Oscillospiraceae bacterium]HPF56310.1 M23 family metallopeptidase [Clostridiales bacterium]HPK34235.1 M23 family metallopeptidase [Oscillospiraceae bacterium]HPR74862.1 M23 family metallopeptidase [Oscillospiraceae bacterium]